MTDSQAVVELRNVTKRYGAADDPRAVTVLDGVSLTIAAGDTLSVVGPSGSGKSTFLNILGALDAPTSGAVLLDGTNLATQSEQELAVLRNRDIGFVFQLHHLLPQCTTLENVLVPTLPCASGDDRERLRDRAVELLDRVGLGERRDHRPASLSGGERQRVAVVRALINQPKLLLADEPTGSLDQEAAESLAALLVELNQDSGVTLIVVTHSLKLAERMQHVYTLRGGTLEEAGGNA